MDNIAFLTELCVQDIIGFIVEDTGIEYDEAIDRFYRSETFKKLNDPKTGMYRDSAAHTYELYKLEQINKKSLA